MLQFDSRVLLAAKTIHLFVQHERNFAACITLKLSLA
jgi:hypothetical protein